MVTNRLREIRLRRRIGVTELARTAEVQRQTIHAIEAGKYIPNTAVALRLAAKLEVSVEELFQLDCPVLPREHCILAEVLTSNPRDLDRNIGVRLARVAGSEIAVPVEARLRSLGWMDGLIRRRLKDGRAEIEVVDESGEWEDRVVLAGCDPAVSLLTREADRIGGCDALVASCSSSKALEWLRGNQVHVAGMHLRDPLTGQFNLPEVQRAFGLGEVGVWTFAHWEAGILTRTSNPKQIKGIPDLGRPEVRIINREPGAGNRELLDRRLRAEGIDTVQVNGYSRIAFGHLEAAMAVHDGKADAAIATRCAAAMFNLGFIPLETQRYDLVVRRSDVTLPMVQALLDALQSLSVRRKLSGLLGYDTVRTGFQVNQG